MIEQVLEQVIGTSRAVCSGVAQSPWLADLSLTCNLSNEVLAGVLVIPPALLWTACDLLMASSRTRDVRMASATRFKDFVDPDTRRAQAEWATGAGEQGRHKPEALHENTRLAAPMFGPIRVMRWV